MKNLWKVRKFMRWEDVGLVYWLDCITVDIYFILLFFMGFKNDVYYKGDIIRYIEVCIRLFYKI